MSRSMLQYLSAPKRQKQNESEPDSTHSEKPGDNAFVDTDSSLDSGRDVAINGSSEAGSRNEASTCVDADLTAQQVQDGDSERG